MDPWNHDLSPEPARSPPPKMTSLTDYEVWDHDQTSIASEHERVQMNWTAPVDDNTFSSDPSLELRVRNSLLSSVPKNVLSHHLQAQSPLVPLNQNRPMSTRNRSFGDKREADHLTREVKWDQHVEQLQTHLVDTMPRRSGVVSQNRDELDELSKLHKTIEVLSASNTRLTEENKILNTKFEEERKHSNNISVLFKESQNNEERIRDELKRCQGELEAVNSRCLVFQESLERAKSRCGQLESKLSDSSSIETSKVLVERAHALEAENRRLLNQSERSLVALDEKANDCQSLSEENTKLRERLSKIASCKDISVQTDSRVYNSVAVQPTSAVLGLDANSISERLSNARDATERTILIRQHQDEVARLVNEHEENIRDLEFRHSNRLKEVEEQSSEELMTRLQQLRRSLTAENQKRIEEMERKHRQELTKIREERDRKIASTTNALETSLAQVTASTQQLEQEHQRRIALENRLEELSNEYQNERNSLMKQHRQEVEALRLTVEHEKVLLLEAIQKGCNEVITNSRHLAVMSNRNPISRGIISKSVQPPDSTQEYTSYFTSPLSIDVSASSHLSSTKNVDNTKIGTEKEAFHTKNEQSNFTTITPTSLSLSLAETEALVQKVLGGSL
jgi:hypothetical protein